MKNVVNVAVLSILMGLSVNAFAGRGGDNPRMEPFSGNIENATPREQQSIYYRMAVVRAEHAKKLAAEKQAESK